MEPLTEREISLIEKLGTMKHIMEIHELIMIALVTRCGREVVITDDEMDFITKNYELVIDIHTTDRTRDVKLKVRTK